jgi:hypothetical protein
MIYSHVDTKFQLPDQNGYFLELLRVEPDAFGVITEDAVTTIRYMVAGHVFMRFAKKMSDKQGKWIPTFTPDEDHAHQMLREHIKIDSTIVDTGSAAKTTVRQVCELTVGLTEADLVAIDKRSSIDARWRACHWAANHLGTPEIDATGRLVLLTGGSD